MQLHTQVSIIAHNLAGGGSGISPGVFETLVKMFNKKVIPLIPKTGSIGMSDLAPLAHLSLPLIGKGLVEYEGCILNSKEAFSKANINTPQLGAIDGLALVSSNAVSIGYGAMTMLKAIRYMFLANLVATCSIEALQGNTDSLNSSLVIKRPHPGQIKVMEEISLLLQGSDILKKTPRTLQDPISFRCIPQVHGSCLDLINYARERMEIDLNSVCNNPTLLIEQKKIIGTGNFHTAQLSVSFDSIAIGFAQVASLSAARTSRLNEQKYTGLPDQLIKDNIMIGVGALQKTITSIYSEIRHLGNPASLDYLPVAGSVEDHSTMCLFSIDKLNKQLDLLLYSLAIELVTALHAIDIRDVKDKLGVAAAKIYKHIRDILPPMTKDRILSNDIEIVYEELRSLRIYDKMKQIGLGVF